MKKYAVSIAALILSASLGYPGFLHADEGDALIDASAMLEGAQKASPEEASSMGFNAQVRLQGGVANLFGKFKDRFAKANPWAAPNPDSERTAAVTAWVNQMSPEQKATLRLKAKQKIEELPAPQKQELLQRLERANASHDSSLEIVTLVLMVLGAILQVFLWPYNHWHRPHRHHRHHDPYYRYPYPGHDWDWDY